MHRYIVCNSINNLWIKTIEAVLEDGERVGKYLEVCNLLIECSDVNNISAELINIHSEKIGREYWDRANIIYTKLYNLKWKESYKLRLVSWDKKYNQINEILDRIKKAPNSKTLWCTLLHPKDLIRAHVIPASFPCVIAIGFKIRKDKLNIEFIFRSQDVLKMALPDIYYLKIFHKEILEKINNFHDSKKYFLGKSTFYLSSAFIMTNEIKKANNLLSLYKKYCS